MVNESITGDERMVSQQEQELQEKRAELKKLVIERQKDNANSISHYNDYKTIGGSLRWKYLE